MVVSVECDEVVRRKLPSLGNARGYCQYLVSLSEADLQFSLTSVLPFLFGGINPYCSLFFYNPIDIWINLPLPPAEFRLCYAVVWTNLSG
jgi:hypothetical protein